MSRIASRAWRLLRASPGGLVRTALGRILARAGWPRGPRLGRVGTVRWEFPIHLDPLVRLMYWGAYEAFTVAAIRRLLRPGDTFVDVGANVGYLSAVAADRVGATGQVHAFEPSPAHAAWLERLRDLNPGHRIVVNRVAAGAAAGTARLQCTSLANLGWNTLVPGLMEGDPGVTEVEVPVIALGDYLAGCAATLTRIGAIKIDVEGFELPVLEGLRGWLESSGERPTVLCEVAPAAYPSLARSVQELERLVRGLGYEVSDLEVPGRPVSLGALRATTMVVFDPPGAGRRGR